MPEYCLREGGNMRYGPFMLPPDHNKHVRHVGFLVLGLSEDPRQIISSKGEEAVVGNVSH